MREALAVMAKAPRAGEVKTRLVGTLEPRSATELYVAFLKDTLAIAFDAQAVRSSLETVVCHTSAGSVAEFDGIVPAGCMFLTQRGTTLAERLTLVFEDLFCMGFGAVAAMNADSPTLPSAYVLSAFEALEHGADVAIGPSSDGGYYLVAMREMRHEVFAGIEMSTPSVLQQTVRAAENAGLKVALLHEWYDVDTPADLERLRADLGRGVAGAAWTREFLDSEFDRGR